jgi:uncharacterized protein
MKPICVVVLAAIALCTTTPGLAVAQTPNASFEADIVKLMETTGSANSAEQMATMMFQQVTEAMRTSSPNVPPRVFEIANEVVRAKVGDSIRAPNGLISRIVPVYAAHFTRDEILGLLAFYETDLGKKLIQLLPTIVREAATIGQEWGVSLMPDVRSELDKRLRAEGLIK